MCLPIASCLLMGPFSNVMHLSRDFNTQNLPLGVMASEFGGVEPVSVYQLLNREGCLLPFNAIVVVHTSPCKPMPAHASPCQPMPAHDHARPYQPMRAHTSPYQPMLIIDSQSNKGLETSPSGKQVTIV